jgi:hypothetical protein
MNLGAACNRARPHPYQNRIQIYLKVIKIIAQNISLSRVNISALERATLG